VPGVRTAEGRSPISVAIGDFDGDGLEDLAVSNSDLAGGNSIMVRLSQITETATATATGIAANGTGTHLVAASYPGDAFFDVSVSQTTVGLQSGEAPGFTLKGSPVTVTPGATTGNASTITVTPAGGFTGTIALAAAITSTPPNVQNPPTLSFGSSNHVSITSNATGNTVLTISTTAPTRAFLNEPRGPGSWRSGGDIAFAGILLFAIGKRRRRCFGMLVMLPALAILAGGITGCSGSAGTVASNPGTTPGTYTVTLTGTSGAITASNAFTFTVQ
jgi:hypothetical protein